MRFLVLLPLVLIFLSCQSRGPKDLSACHQRDWFEIGRADGLQGLPSVTWEGHQDSCRDFSDADHESYINGWNAAMNEYCSETQGFALGRSGIAYGGICSEPQASVFLKGYELGQKIYNYERDNLQISQEIQALTQKIDRPKGEELGGLIRRLTRLETQMELNQALIRELQSQATSTLR